MFLSWHQTVVTKPIDANLWDLLQIALPQKKMNIADMLLKLGNRAVFSFHPNIHPSNRATFLLILRSMLKVPLGLFQPNTDTSTTSDNWLTREISSVRSDIDRPGCGTGKRNKRISVSSLRGTIGNQVGCDLLGTSRRIPTVDGAVEECKSGDGLVVGHFVTRLVDACE